jgi:hypothetical protein
MSIELPFTLPGTFDLPRKSNYYGPFRFAVEDIHGNFLARDVVGQEPIVSRMLSGPCEIEIKLHPKEPSIQNPSGTGPIQFKPWGQWIHALKDDPDGNEVVWASGLVQPSELDPQSGILTLKAQGFSNYPKGIPWLENWNPITVDPFTIVYRIWDHIQHGHAAGGQPFINGDLGVQVYPTVSGTQMLPGFSFNNEVLVQDFFAIFIRATDRNDCGEYINRLARDIPFDYFEESAWNDTRTAITKKIRLAYPSGGVFQEDLVFRQGENMLFAVPKQESEVEWFSDIIINGYFPGKVYSSTISNADPDRYRRVMDEQDLSVDSNERAKAWGRRKLTRRQFPTQFETIVVDPYHPNAPFLTYDVGDRIRIQGEIPWKGRVDVEHKIMAMTFTPDNKLELRTMAEGSFNYDPIEYVATP